MKRAPPSANAQGQRTPSVTSHRRWGLRLSRRPLEERRVKETQWRQGHHLGLPPLPRAPLPCLRPPNLLALERNVCGGSNNSIRPRRPDRSLYKGYQEPLRRDGRKETQMESDCAESQTLPEQGEGVWRRQQRRRRESAFTSGSPLPTPHLRRPPAFFAVSAQTQETGRRTFHHSMVPRALGLPLESAFVKEKATFNSAANASNKRHKGNQHFLPVLSFYLVLLFFSSFSSPLNFLPRRPPLWAPLRGSHPRWRDCEFPRGPWLGSQGDLGRLALELGKGCP